MKFIPFILLLAGCANVGYEHRLPDGSVVRLDHSRLLVDEKASFAFVRLSDGTTMVLGNASSVPNQASISAVSNAVFMAGVKSLASMFMPMAPLLFGAP